MQSPSKQLKRFHIDPHDALELAESIYPVCWYERKLPRYLVSVAIAFLFLGLQVCVVQHYLDWRLSAIGIVALIVGEAIDIYSTIAVLQLRPHFDRHKLEFPVFEANPCLPNYPTVRNLFLGMPTFIALLMLPLAIIIPAFGIQLFINKVCIALTNHHMNLRLLWVLKVVKEKTKLRVKDYIPDYSPDEYVNVVIGEEGGGLTLRSASLV